MNHWKQKLIHLDHCHGVGWQTMFKILKDDPELEQLYDRPITYWQQIFSHSPLATKPFLLDLQNTSLKTIIYPNIHVLSFLDDFYPKRLTEIYRAPWLLYCVGDLSLLQERNILAIIGTRKPTDHGVAATKFLIPDLVDKGVIIVSGLAKGIDSIAEKCALMHNGKVISVIAGGFEHIYPRENLGLAKQIMKQGLLLSEYPPTTAPQKWQFPMRNRIISGISRGVLVVEGKKRSGTLITVQQGLDQGKDIFAVPGNIFAKEAEGPLSLIKDGAKLVTHSDDILYEWDIKN